MNEKVSKIRSRGNCSFCGKAMPVRRGRPSPWCNPECRRGFLYREAAEAHEPLRRYLLSIGIADPYEPNEALGLLLEEYGYRNPWKGLPPGAFPPLSGADEATSDAKRRRGIRRSRH